MSYLSELRLALCPATLIAVAASKLEVSVDIFGFETRASKPFHDQVIILSLILIETSGELTNKINKYIMLLRKQRRQGITVVEHPKLN